MNKRQIYKISIILALTIFIISPIFVSAAPSAGIKPGSIFYFFDTTFEKINLLFTFNSEKKAQKNLEYADERLAEAEAVAEEKNTGAVKTAVDGYESNIASAAEESKQIKDKKKTEKLLNSIADNTSKHQKVLSDVLSKVPDEAKEAITKAIEASRKGQEEAMKQIAELKGEVEQLKKEVAELKAKGENKTKAQNQPQVIEKKESSNTQTTNTQNKNTISTLPNGAIVEMDANGNIIRYIKKAIETTNIETKMNNGKIEVSKRPFVGDLILKEKTNINGILNFRIYAKDNDVNIEGVKIKVGGSASLSVINSVFATNGGGVYVTNQNSQLDENGEATLNFKLGIKTGSYYDLMIGAYINQNEDENKNIYMSVIGLVTSSEVSGLPINGDVYTIKNQRLPKVIVSPGQVDIRYIFSAIKITSDKKVFLNSIKWYQSGSGGAKNLKTYIDNISYDAISFDSKYFTSNFGGIVINPNETKEIYIKGDNISPQWQWLSFDIYKASDINITDENGNVITPQAEQLWNYENSGGFRSSSPWYDGY